MTFFKKRGWLLEYLKSWHHLIRFTYWKGQPFYRIKSEEFLLHLSEEVWKKWSLPISLNFISTDVHIFTYLLYLSILLSATYKVKFVISSTSFNSETLFLRNSLYLSAVSAAMPSVWFTSECTSYGTSWSLSFCRFKVSGGSELSPKGNYMS